MRAQQGLRPAGRRRGRRRRRRRPRTRSPTSSRGRQTEVRQIHAGEGDTPSPPVPEEQAAAEEVGEAARASTPEE